MEKKTSTRISTEVELISTLISGINKGEIKIPKFQRKFVWKDDQALDLLDSLANNYPVGSLLLWRTKEKLLAERNIGEFSLPSTDDMEPTDYVLDGQQRLTVIYSCLGAKEADGGFAVLYDLESGKFLRLTDSPKLHQFPLRKMFNTTQLLNFRAAIQTQTNGSTYQQRLDALIGAFSDYRLPVVTLKDLSVEEVCPIFERINSSGTRLSTYDLMVAATWNKEFDLNDEVDEIRDALNPKGFGDIDRETVLKCLSAVHLGTIKEQSLMTLRKLGKEKMRELISTTSGSLLRTVDLLATEFNIYSWEFLSYEAIAVILCYVYAKINHLDSEQVQRARQWFWRSAFGERYKVGGEGFVSNDLKTVYDFIVEDNGTGSNFGIAPTTAEWKEISFRSNVSRSRAYVLALAARNPRNLTNGAYIDPAIALSSYNKKQFHHIFPRAYLKREKTQLGDNLLINICMIAAAGNNYISDSDPNQYLPECAGRLAREADEVFSSNLLPPPSSFDYSKAGYKDFLDERAKIVARFANEVCNGAIPAGAVAHSGPVLA
jgi:hypothetical protein